jgi:ketosteroid isomerase-like protein
VSDPIPPLTARRPAEAVELVSLAVSDGDAGAALAQYEPAAPLRPWASQTADGTGIQAAIRQVMDLRLPLSVEIRMILPAAGLVLVVAERLMAGTGPDGQPVRLRGLGCSVVRRQPDATWRIAADAWCLAEAAGRPRS